MSGFWLTLGAFLVIAIAFVLRFWRSTGRRLRLEGGNLYYTDSVSPEVAQRAGLFLERKGLFKAGLNDARLYRDGEAYLLQLVCSLGQPEEEQNVASEVLAAGFSDDVLTGSPVEVQICDFVLRPTSVIRHRGRFGRRIGMNAASFFYTEGVSEAEAMRVATFLAAAGLFNDSPKVAQLNRSDEGFEFRLAVDVDPLTDEMDTGQQKMAADLSHDVLGGVPVQVYYCKGLAATLRTDRASVKTDGIEESVLPRGRTYRSKVFRVPHDLSGDDVPGDP
jgi:hypothetical protein